MDQHLKIYSITATSKENQLRFKYASKEDWIQKKINYYVPNGWPNHKSGVPAELKHYWSIKNDTY